MKTRVILRGTIAGHIWQPGVGVCWKQVRAEIVPSDADTYPYGGPYPDLRTAMLALANDGDFQSCGFVEAWIEVERAWNGGTRRVRIRDIAFACEATDDLQADADVLAEYEEGAFYGADVD